VPVIAIFVIVLWPLAFLAMIPALVMRYAEWIDIDYWIILTPIWLPLSLVAAFLTLWGVGWVLVFFWAILASFFQ
jgi:hypothetical protein